MGTQTRTVVTYGECGTDPKTAQVDWNHLTDLFRARTEVREVPGTFRTMRDVCQAVSRYGRCLAPPVPPVTSGA
jgi:hypothetical protein